MADEEPQEYTVVINGLEHTMMLTAEDAKAYGENATKKKAASSKAQSPSNKSATGTTKKK